MAFNLWGWGLSTCLRITWLKPQTCQLSVRKRRCSSQIKQTLRPCITVALKPKATKATHIVRVFFADLLIVLRTFFYPVSLLSLLRSVLLVHYRQIRVKSRDLSLAFLQFYRTKKNETLRFLSNQKRKRSAAEKRRGSLQRKAAAKRLPQQTKIYSGAKQARDHWIRH